MGILQGLTRDHVVAHNQPQFVDSAEPLNGIEKDLVKSHDLLLTRRQALIDGNLPEGVHDGGNFDPLRASGRAGFTRCTEPNGGTLENRFSRVDLNMPENLAGFQIHLRGDGAAGRALTALDATGCVLTAEGEDFASELVNVFLPI
jgi:hypothetical protein